MEHSLIFIDRVCLVPPGFPEILFAQVDKLHESGQGDVRFFAGQGHAPATMVKGLEVCNVLRCRNGKCGWSGQGVNHSRC